MCNGKMLYTVTGCSECFNFAAKNTQKSAILAGSVPLKKGK